MSATLDEARAKEAFAQHLKPRLAEQLRAIGLDRIYHRAEGDRLWFTGDDGAEVEVLDLLGGFGASLFGHNHPELVARLRQLLDEKRPFHAQASVRGFAGLLAERLSERVGRATGKHYVVTLANSGTEAVEAAVKHAEMEAAERNRKRLAGLQEMFKRVRIGLRDGTVTVPPDLSDRAGRLFELTNPGSLDDLFMRLYRRALEALEREPSFLVIEGAFHGKTTGSLMLTYNPDYRAAWTRIGLRTTFLPAGDERALDAAVTAARIELPALTIEHGVLQIERATLCNISGCFAEPIQGEGGIREIVPDYLAALRRAADQGQFPLIFDEIQTGMGRTGTFLASEKAQVRGDYYLLSKSLGAGLAKISALLVDADRYQRDFGYLHTSTFADDDHASALALTGLELLDRDGGALLRQCRDKGEYLLGRLQALKARFPEQLGEVRGRGLMLGLELLPQPESPSPLVRVLGEQNLLGFVASGYLLHQHRIRVAPTLSSHGTLRVEPSAYISVADLDRFCDAIEKLLIALRDADTFTLTRCLVGGPDREPPRRAAPKPIERSSRAPSNARVAFLAHFLEPADLAYWDPTLGALDDDECRRFLLRTRGLLDPFLVDRVELVSATGDRVNATVIGIPFLPEQVMDGLRSGDSAWALELVRAGVERARREGASVVGFGGYTSIVSDNCRAIVEDQLALTSGNALTASAALEALLSAARRLRIGRARLGVVGAAGNIGAVLAEAAAPEVEELVLVGRKGAASRLQPIADRIAAATRTPVRVATEMEALRDCPLILSASNSARPIILPEHVSNERVVICDVAQPRDVAPEIKRERPNALVLKGGMIRLPLGQRIELGGMRLHPGQVYGCLAETLLLGLARVREHFSYGQLTADHLRHVRDLARQHGFLVDEFPAD